MINKQEIFDIVKNGLLNQNEKCEITRFVENDGVTDLYAKFAQYHYNGLKCSIGFLIPENEYDPEFENDTIHDESRIGQYFISKGYSKQDLKFLQELQEIHDETDIEDWEIFLSIIGSKYKLTYNWSNMKEKNQESLMDILH